MDKNIKIFLSVIGVLIIGIIILAFIRSDDVPAGPGIYDEFAQCLADEGVVFYGAFWCSVCNAQKKVFGSSAKLLPYKECSTPDSKSQLADCREKNIKGYPTWEFVDGSRMTGKLSLEQLAEKTSCKINSTPATEDTSATQQ